MFDQVWVKALFLVIIHLTLPIYRPFLLKYDRLINAFGAGMVISYVFLHLLPEINEGADHLGQFTFIIVLVGYVLFYFIQLAGKSKYHGYTQKGYIATIVGNWLYSFVFIIGLPNDHEQSHLHVFLMTLAVGIHVLHEDYELSEKTTRFLKSGKYILASAPVIGLIYRWYFLPESDLVVHFITSILAGSIIYTVARKELPNPNWNSLLWFFTGIALYAGLLLLITVV